MIYLVSKLTAIDCAIALSILLSKCV